MKNFYLAAGFVGVAATVLFMGACNTMHAGPNAYNGFSAQPDVTPTLIDSSKLKAFSLAIQSHDVQKVKEILAEVPKSENQRAPKDSSVINEGLYIATLDGLNCDAQIVDLLEKDYGARFPKFRAVDLFSLDKTDSNTPLCDDVVARSFASMGNKADAVVEVNNHYVELLKYSNFDDLGEIKAARFNKLLVEASKTIVQACEKSNVDPVCAVKGAYLDFANKTKLVKSKWLKKNSKDVLKILGSA